MTWPVLGAGGHKAEQRESKETRPEQLPEPGMVGKPGAWVHRTRPHPEGVGKHQGSAGKAN